MSSKITILLTVLAVFGICLPVGGQPWDGNGVEGDPYLIYTPEDMQAIGADSDYWRAHFLLCDNIDLSAYTGTSFNIIGTSYLNGFMGVFDGNDHTISNFTYTSTSGSCIAIFGCIDYDYSIIRNIGLINPSVYFPHTITGNGGVGSLVGLLKNGIISGCWSDGGSVTGDTSVGGLIGTIWGGIITDCYSSTDVIGGAGFLQPDWAGGLAGRNAGKIYNCYSTGNVSGTGNLGGLLGYNDGVVLNCFWDKQTSGQTSSAGGTGKTTAEMQDMNTFLDAGWDFLLEQGNGPSDIWAEPDGGGYPVLWWQVPEFMLPVLPTFSGGNGEPDSPYLISTFTDLNKIGHNPRLMKAHFKLVDDIDLNGVDFFIIGSPGEFFSGVFDGDEHTISNFTYASGGKDYAGLFGCVYGSTAQVKNLEMLNPNVDAATGDNAGAMVGQINYGNITNCRCNGGTVTGDDRIGGLVGRIYFGNISNSHSTTSVTGDDVYVGGLAGYFSLGNISNSSSSATVVGGGIVGGLTGNTLSGNIYDSYSSGESTGMSYVGGLVGSNSWGTISNSYSTANVIVTIYTHGGGLTGYNSYGNISNCYATGSVMGPEDYIAGLVGYNLRGTISNCYATGAVDGNDYTGGLIGRNSNSSISNCYAGGLIDGNDYTGGLVGYDYNDTYTSCFWNNDVNPLLVGIGNGSNPNVTGETTANMQTASTFISAGWDFINESGNGIEDIWRLCNEGAEYPQLQWGFALGDIVCGDGVDSNDLEILCEQWLFEELPADLAPDGGDGIVNFLDWAVFAEGWQIAEDYDSLAAFAEQWLKTGSNYLNADIAPVPVGDKIVNMLDFAVLAENWLAGK